MEYIMGGLNCPSGWDVGMLATEDIVGFEKGGGGVALSQILTDWQTGWSEMSDALRWDTDRLTRKLITWLTAVALRATGQTLIWYPTPAPAPPQPRLPWFSTFSLPLHLTFYLTVSLTATPCELCLFLELSVDGAAERKGQNMRRGNEQVPEWEKLTRAFISLLRKISEFSVKRVIFLSFRHFTEGPDVFNSC